MPTPVVFRPQAEDDVLEARAYYESRRVGLGREFGVAVEALVTRIADNPLLFPKVDNETRRAVLSRFACAIYFRLSDEVAVVLAIHGRQNPSRWQTRE